MRFDTLQEFIQKFNECPFCKSKASVSLGGSYANHTNQYEFTSDSLEIFIGHKSNKIATISLLDNKATPYVDPGLFPNLFHNKAMSLFISCKSVTCKMNGCSFTVKSHPLALDIKNVKIFSTLLYSYSVMVPLEHSQAEYAWNDWNNKTRLTLFTFKPRAYKNKDSAISWEENLDNQIDYKQQKLITFFKDLPAMNIDQLNNKESLISRAQILVTFS